jgi:hypothetical protein
MGAAKEFQRALAAGEKIELHCPIKEASYLPHAGAAFAVECSPFHVSVLEGHLNPLVPNL